MDRVQTQDGSFTYAHPGHGATYRSMRGALSESKHVFLQGSRLQQRRENCWRVLELGFGTGLNFAVTAQAAVQAGRGLHYEALEPDPLPKLCWLVDESWKNSSWGTPMEEGSITLTIHRRRWQELPRFESGFHALYHDPFGPAQNPDCWTSECFSWGASALCPDGVLATFGASTRARQAMQVAGLHVGVLPGALGKREMTAASKSLESLDHARLWRPGAWSENSPGMTCQG